MRLSIIVPYRRGVAAERRNPNCHEREQWEIGHDIVQFLSIGNIEYAEIGVTSRHPPQVTPNAHILQFFCTLTLGLL